MKSLTDEWIALEDEDEEEGEEEDVMRGGVGRGWQHWCWVWGRGSWSSLWAVLARSIQPYVVMIIWIVNCIKCAMIYFLTGWFLWNKCTTLNKQTAMTSNIRWSWWTSLISNKFHKTLKIPGLWEHCLLKSDEIAHKSEMWIKRNTNPSPNFIVIQFDLAAENQWKIHGEKSENQSEQIQTSVSPNFIVKATPPLTLRPF